MVRNNKRRKRGGRRRPNRKEQQNKPKLKDFDSTGQSETINTLGTKAEYFYTKMKCGCFAFIFILGVIMIIFSIKDSVVVKIGEIMISCQHVGVALCIISMLCLFLLKPKVIIK